MVTPRKMGTLPAAISAAGPANANRYEAGLRSISRAPFHIRPACEVRNTPAAADQSGCRSAYPNVSAMMPSDADKCAVPHTASTVILRFCAQ